MHSRIRSGLLILFILTAQNVVFSQTAAWHGQISGWLTGSPEKTMISQLGVRYLPDIFLEKTLNGHLLAGAEISFNTYVTGDFQGLESPDAESLLKPYRLWARFAGDQFEARIGLQKINFGSATLFRPLMWFDRIDPRDPLKLTDGVYGLLIRYYFQNNANIWLWGLYDNNELKGWETAPTIDNGAEFGGRFQLPLPTGEAGYRIIIARLIIRGSPVPEQKTRSKKTVLLSTVNSMLKLVCGLKEQSFIAYRYFFIEISTDMDHWC